MRLIIMNTEWNNYIQSLSNKYGKLSNHIWISKKRNKYILEFADSEVLIINDEKYDFKDILSCRIEKPHYDNICENSSEPYVVLIGTKDKTNLLISITVWSKRTADTISCLIKNITMR